LTRNEPGGKRRKKYKQGYCPPAPHKKKSLQNRGEDERKNSQFFFETHLQKSSKEKFPKKMKRKRNEKLKSEKGREAAYDLAGDRKMPAVFRVEKEIIVHKNENNHDCHGEQDTYFALPQGKAEIFERFFEEVRGNGSRENGKKKKRKPESFSVCFLGKYEAHQDDKRGAKTDQQFPPGEFFAVFCFNEVQSHNIF
jgi:hypothetical protein